jgi:Arc/MetJ-type ribon-helix-helix transcriptional regulator
MNLTLKKPELERYIDDLVKAGRFPSAEAVVEDALLRAMMNGEDTLTPEDLTAIELSEQQLDAGQGIDSKEVAAQMRALYGQRPS